jgi:hypothetical protein
MQSKAMQRMGFGIGYKHLFILWVILILRVLWSTYVMIVQLSSNVQLCNSFVTFVQFAFNVPAFVQILSQFKVRGQFSQFSSILQVLCNFHPM